ncbi:sulfatase family protein [Occallatibacter riparius]|uniref:Sulfatase-like hydrolase/transferase n=1 Tax=Occallatibacter riparius TaxID=1002689 RepID=A0A9J7BY04_9BACT|nr:sulfatase-like hydrolase/transferase [Occallatibacter riparius]UWZ86922.1 sulfatase-like hydrolase/transferase [Occallatibacter riparius]
MLLSFSPDLPCARSHMPCTSRRTVLRQAGMGAAALAFGVQKLVGEHTSAKPNIVFIVADDLGYADVSCYGRPDLHTPHIDSLALSGVRFTQAYANSAVCSATRTALITGRYQDRLDVGLDEPLVDRDTGLPPEHPTLPSLLRKAGYGTTLVGKWHLGILPKYGPLRSGYEHFYGFRGGAVDYFTHSDDLWDEDVKVQQAGYLTHLLGDRAVQVVDRYAKERRPFLLSLHFNAPHWPWEGPEDEGESRRLVGRPMSDFDGGSQRTYQRMLEDLDLQVGRVLDALRSHAILDNTIVIFTSDNGGERFADTWPFTGRKTELLEGGLRIPAIVSWPARLPAGKTTSQVAMSMDWVPTLLAAAGTAPDPAYPSDGIDLLPFLTAGVAPISRKVFWRYKANAQHAVRDGDMKYLKILDNTFLFNVVDDPMERANLKERLPDTYSRLVAEWAAWNRTMLPEIDASFTSNFTGANLADHIGTPAASHKADNPSPHVPSD